MKTNRLTVFAIFLALVFAVTASTPASAASAGVPANPNNPGTTIPGTGGYGYSRGVKPGQGAGRGGLVLGPLSDTEIDGLLRAIQEEYRAQALYQSIVDTFGDAYPFNYIVLSEAQHASQLVRLAQKYGVAVPDANNLGELPEFSTLAAACEAGVDAEIADAALYDEIMPATTHADLLRVYANLKAASLNNHLPAFQACE